VEDENEKKVVLVLFLSVIIVTSNNAQSIFVGIGGGYSSMNPTEYHVFIYQYERFSYPGIFEEITGLKNDKGYNISGYFKYDIKMLPINIVGGIGYTKYSGKADYVKATVPPWYSTMYFIGEYETKNDLLSINAGIQYEIIPTFITPYISLQAVLNKFDATTLELKNSGRLYEEVKFESKTRYGLSIGGGLNINILPVIDTNLEVIYTLSNLIGKEGGENSLNSFNINLVFLYQVF
jgi:opacity protein-like surface antigen